MKYAQHAYRVVIGRVIAHHRSNRDIHQKDLAATVGIAQSTLSRLERGEVAPDAWQTRLLAEAFRLTPSDLQHEFDQAFEAAQQAAMNNTADQTDPWGGIKAAAGVVGIAALAGFAIAALFADDSEDDDDA